MSYQWWEEQQGAYEVRRLEDRKEGSRKSLRIVNKIKRKKEQRKKDIKYTQGKI